jgi:hypothetical protein
LNCSKKKKTETPQWKGKIEYENGIKIIKNPIEPVFGELILDLEEDLIIGNEEDENYMFYRVRDIEVDAEGNIYVLDAGNYRVQRFDKNGAYLQTIGKKGQGPGEFERPNNLFIDAQNNIYVSEGRKIQIFNNPGEFIKSIPINYYIYNFFIDSATNIITQSSIRSKEGSSKLVIMKFDSQGKIMRKIAEFSDVKSVKKKGSEGIIVFTIYHSYNYRLYLSPASEQTFIYGYSSEYKLFKMDNNCNLISKIEKEEPYYSISQKEKNRMYRFIEERISRGGRKWPKDVIENACQFPPHRPFFNGILTDDKGRIYVRRVGSILDKTKEVEFDVFNREGVYIYKLKLPFIPRIIRNGFIFEIFTSEETGEVKIKRYKIKNWWNIKENI